MLVGSWTQQTCRLITWRSVHHTPFSLHNILTDSCLGFTYRNHHAAECTFYTVLIVFRTNQLLVFSLFCMFFLSYFASSVYTFIYYIYRFLCYIYYLGHLCIPFCLFLILLRCTPDCVKLLKLFKLCFTILTDNYFFTVCSFFWVILHLPYYLFSLTRSHDKCTGTNQIKRLNYI